MKLKRLKIVEQIIIISLAGVLVPSVISWIVINNISQHSLRQELRNSAQMYAKVLENNISSVIKSDKHRLNELAISLKYVQAEQNRETFLKDVSINSEIFDEFEIIHPSENPDFDVNRYVEYDNRTGYLWIMEKIHDDKYLRANVNTEVVKKNIFENLEAEKFRRIYIINKHGDLLFSLNYNEEDFKESIRTLPSKLQSYTVMSYGKAKNRPCVYLKIKDLDLIIIVNTSEKLTKTTINRARFKILAAFLVSAAVALILTLLYGYYLYTNIRRLFRGIIAVTGGNYNKTVTPLVNAFTPVEIIFLSEKFNAMINEINESYKELQEKNIELNRLNEFRSNLVDTVSHELRTPLTSIRGYSSRLLRTDITIDEETKRKSLLIIKQQSERLARMIEDLLVIPDIEGAKLNIIKERVNILNAIEASLYSVKNIEEREIENYITNDIPDILADKDRFEQVLINIIGNAHKYAYEGTPIKITAKHEADNMIISVSNSADYIASDVLNMLFDKFIRLDDKTTRTTRGTGLGLYIVKGLVENMGGKVELESSVNNIFTVRLIFPVYKEGVLEY